MSNYQSYVIQGAYLFTGLQLAISINVVIGFHITHNGPLYVFAVQVNCFLYVCQLTPLDPTC